MQSIAVKCLGILFKRVQEAQARSLSACVCACLSLCGISDHVSGFAPQPHRPTHQPNNKPQTETGERDLRQALRAHPRGYVTWAWVVYVCVCVHVCVSLSNRSGCSLTVGADPPPNQSTTPTHAHPHTHILNHTNGREAGAAGHLLHRAQDAHRRRARGGADCVGWCVWCGVCATVWEALYMTD